MEESLATASVGSSCSISSESSDSLPNPRAHHHQPGYTTPPGSGHSVRSNRVPNRPLVYVTRRIPQKGMDVLLDACDVKQWDAEEPVPRGELLQSVVGADGILCMQCDVIDADVLDAAGPSLQVVATTASSTGQIDVIECKARGVQVLTCPSQPTETLADLTLALVILTIKETQTEEERLANFDLLAPDLIPTVNTGDGVHNALEALTNARTHSRPRLIQQMSEERLAFQWNNGKPGNANCSTWRNILKKRFGIYGLTRLGLSVAQLLNSLGMCDVMLADQAWESGQRQDGSVSGKGSHFKMVTLDEMLRRSDVICLCDAAVPDSSDDGEAAKIVFCREAFEKMSPDAIVVTSRSCQPAVDYVDLYAALRDGQIRGAGLNDCNQEPVPLKAPLLGLRNCVFLPQTQESVYDMRHKVSVLITQNLTDALSLSREKSHTM